MYGTNQADQRTGYCSGCGMIGAVRCDRKASQKWILGFSHTITLQTIVWNAEWLAILWMKKKMVMVKIMQANWQATATNQTWWYQDPPLTSYNCQRQAAKNKKAHLRGKLELWGQEMFSLSNESRFLLHHEAPMEDPIENMSFLCDVNYTTGRRW